MHIDKNMGKADRLIRTAVATELISLYTRGKVKGALGIGLLVLSGIFLVTSAAGHCPAYKVAGVSTLDHKTK